MIPLELVQDYFNDNEEGMRKLLTWFLNLVMQIEALHQVGADPYERTESRKTQRNGYKDRSRKTRYGEISLKKPQFREFPFETELFGKYARVEKALVNAIAESYLQGVSTKKIQTIVSHLGIEQISPSSVSRISKELDEHVHEFLNRPIESRFPYLFVDASYFKVRDGMRYVNKALKEYYLSSSFVPVALSNVLRRHGLHELKIMLMSAKVFLEYLALKENQAIQSS